MFTYLARLFSDSHGDPSAKRFACFMFAITAVVLATLQYDFAVVACFTTAAVGENVVSVFEPQPPAPPSPQ